MKISIGETLVIEGGIDSPEDMSGAVQDKIQLAAFLRAKWGKAWNRGGTILQFSFAKTRDHADFRAAELFLFQHIRDLPRKGLIYLDCQGPGGAETRLTLTDGALAITGFKQIGKTTIHNYQIIGGILS